jgi:hypothetical protein
MKLFEKNIYIKKFSNFGREKKRKEKLKRKVYFDACTIKVIINAT